MRVAQALIASCMLVSGITGTAAFAQSQSGSDLMAMNDDALVDELGRRYQSGLSISSDKAVIAANDPRYLWALETKVQCGIAIGFMKSSTRDETSIGNCAKAYDLMNRAPAAPIKVVVAPPPPPPRPNVCNQKITGMVFFEFDSTVISPDAQTTIATLAEQTKACARTALAVTGHTDQAGADDYNIALSRQRAEAVAAAMRSIVGPSVRLDVDAQGERNPRVPLADGTRSPENRRVEISAE